MVFSQNLIKKCIHAIAPQLSHIINLSLSQGKVPTNMKISKVLPIHKAGDIFDFKNHRPISLVPCLSKILEKVVYDQLYSFLSSNNILYNFQFGFRRMHSTEHAFIDFYDKVSKALQSKQHSLGLFLDLSKVFDVMNHHF